MEESCLGNHLWKWKGLSGQPLMEMEGDWFGQPLMEMVSYGLGNDVLRLMVMVGNRFR